MRAARASRPLLAMLAGLLMAAASVCGQMIITKSALAPAPPSASPRELEIVYPTDIDETTPSTPLLSYLGSGNVSAGLDCEPLLQTAGWPAAAAVAVGALTGAPRGAKGPLGVLGRLASLAHMMLQSYEARPSLPTRRAPSEACCP
jgi:hypothetical protein